MIYNAENFPELPRGWASLTVDNSVESTGNSNKKLKSKDALNHGRFPVIDQGQSDISGYSDDESLVVDASESSPVILFGDHTRLLKKISQPFVPGADGTKLFRAKSFWDTRFVYQMLRAIKLPDKGYARHFQYLRESVLPLPPLPEQKRIADKLDAVLARVDACRDRLDRIPAILKRFRQSVLAAATSGKLTEEWRAENGYSLDDWTTNLLGSLVKDSANGLSKRRGDVGNETVVLRLADFKNSERVQGNERTIKLDGKELEKYSLTTGDLLVVRVNGSRDLAGKFIIYESRGGEVEAYCDHFIRLRLNRQLIAPQFALFVANSGAGRHYVESVLLTTAGQNTINQTALFGLNIGLPPLAEQTEIVRRVESLFSYADRLEASYTSARAHVEKLTPATLAKAFRGELVPQDPNDEPASVLLDRIKAQHGGQPANKPKKSHKVAA